MLSVRSKLLSKSAVNSVKKAFFASNVEHLSADPSAGFSFGKVTTYEPKLKKNSNWT